MERYQNRRRCTYFSMINQTVYFSYAVPRFRFSRFGLGSDVSVSVVNVAVDDSGEEENALAFPASPNAPLPIAEGLGNTPLPTGCSISSLEFNTYNGWEINSFSGFSLAERDSRVYLEV